MTKTIFSLLLTLALFSCDSKSTTSKNPQEESKKAIANENIAQLQGLWISESYLKDIETSKSIYSSRDYRTKVQGFTLDAKNLQTDSAFLEGFTPHEIGYSSPIKYDSVKSKFVNDLTRLSDFPAFSDPFELDYDGNNHLKMYFPQTKTFDEYRKVDTDLQTELRKILIAGKYKTTTKPAEIQFDNDGKVHNFKDFKYYELITDFGEGIEYDAIIFFKTLDGGNWVDGEIYHFKVVPSGLQLQLLKPNWETMEHVISKEILALQRK
ncbi:hypothetical protein [Haliscomenobacter sp.]|uniref:hypothetical protein n=1 Tax=Haliscomenobacter sp. TaxID=2717303 RepID=UPI003BA89BB1